jgi:hypothetical protein
MSCHFTSTLGAVVAATRLARILTLGVANR